MRSQVRTGRLACVAMLALLAAGCGGGGDAAGALDDRLAGALEFDGGEVVDAAPPAGLEGSSAPQVALLTAPGTLVLGRPFIVSVTADFSLPTDVDKAVVYVGDKPSRHIVVTWGLVQSGQTWQMNLAGILTPDDQLRGKSFKVRLALQTKTGVTGVYDTWNLTISEQMTEQPQGRLIEGIRVAGEEWRDSGRPAGSAGQDVPQVSGAEAPSSVDVGDPFSVMLRSDNLTGGQQVAAVLISTPGNAGYKLTTGFSVRPATRSGSSFIVEVVLTVTDPRLRGFDLVLLLALQDGTGQTGLLYPVQFAVSQSLPDGDGVPDGDAGVDGDQVADGDSSVDGDTAVDGDTQPDGDSSVDGDTETDGDTSIGPIWVDPTTGLMWQNPRAEALMSWQTGMTYCQDLVLDGHDDWRLPGIGELRSLVRGCDRMERAGGCNVREGECLFGGCSNDQCYDCAYLQGPGPAGFYTEAVLMPEEPWTEQYHWSSAANVDDTAYCLAYDSASLRGYYTFNELGIRCVRGGSGADGDVDGDGDALPDGDQTADGDAEPDQEEPSYVLPDTNQGDDRCVTYSGTAWDYAACSSIDRQSPYYGQDGHYVPVGRQHAYADTGDGAVTDLTTGLVWQRCVDGMSGADCSTGAASAIDWAAAVAVCEGLLLGGHEDWRLPTIPELYSLIDLSGAMPLISPVAFPAQPSGKFWSSNEYLRDTSTVLYANYFDGSLNSIDKAEVSSMRTRCVRGGPYGRTALASAEAGPLAERIVTDQATGLIWQGCQAGRSGSFCGGTATTAAWADALAYCEGLNWGGHDDWRLPNLTELMSIFDPTIMNGIDLSAFPGTITSWFWTSSVSPTNRSYSYRLIFNSGDTLAGVRNDATVHIRCVRGGL